MLQNYVAIRTLSKSFNDLDYTSQTSDICVSCEIKRSTVFTLRGICKDSYLETEYFPTICGGHIGFIGNKMNIW